MNIHNIELFSSLSIDERESISCYFQEYLLMKWETLLNIWDDLIWAYLLLSWQIVASNELWKWLGFINKDSIIWISVIYNYATKEKIIPIKLTAYQDCIFLIMPISIIKNLTDKDRVVFRKMIDQIKEEKRVF